MAKVYSKGAKGKIDPYPDPAGATPTNKRTLRLSGSGVLRRREPTNEHIARKTPNMVFDHSKQMAVWPNNRKDALIEASFSPGGRETDYKYDTMNRGGRPYALGVEVGGSPDDQGVVFDKGAPKVKILGKGR